MLVHFLKQKLPFVLFFILFCCAAGKAKAGLDSYEIYLNDKLILKQYVNEPLKLASLQLSRANVNDRIVINYSQCNMPDKIGKGRSISVKDAKGKTIKVWKFTNASSTNASMIIPVKDLLALNQSMDKDLAFYYAAEGLSKGQMLAHFKLGNKPVSYIKAPLLNNADFRLAVSLPVFNLFWL